MKNCFQTLSYQRGKPQSLEDNVVSALYEAPDGMPYIGTEGGGISLWDRIR